MLKGCLNKECAAMHKRIKYKTDDFFCSKCGKDLYHVCKQCFKVVEQDEQSLCDECLRKKELKQEKRKETASKVIDGAKMVAPLALEIAKNPKVKQGAKKTVNMAVKVITKKK